MLDENTRRYYVRLGTLLREATLKCSRASERWNAANEEFNDWYRRQFPDNMNPIDGAPADPVHYTDIKQKNLGLNDAEAEWSHWEREAVRLSAAIQGGWALMQMLDKDVQERHAEIIAQRRTTNAPF